MTTPPAEAWTLSGADDQPIFGHTHLPAQPDAAPAVLLLAHGFKGYKDYGFFSRFAQLAAAEFGLIAHRFNFSHCGVTERYETFERPDLFQADTYGKQIHDLHTLSLAVHDARLPGGAAAAAKPQAWFGHSRGGITTLLAAARAFSNDADLLHPHRVIAASTPAQAMRLDPASRELLHRQGYLESPSNRTGQMLRIGLPWLQEIEADRQAFDPLRAVAALACPVLLLHGEADTTVSVDDATRLAQAGGPHVECVTIPEASHTFNCPNPLPDDAELPDATHHMIETACHFASGCQ